MPLVHNDSASRTSGAPTESVFVSSLNAIRSANETDAVIKSVAFAKTREVLNSEITARLNTVAEEISAGTRSPTGRVTFKVLAPHESVTPTDSRFTAEQFQSRGFDTFATMLGKWSPKKLGKKEMLEREVLMPIKEQLEASGFTDVSFSLDHERKPLQYEYWHTLNLSLALPQI